MPSGPVGLLIVQRGTIPMKNPAKCTLDKTIPEFRVGSAFIAI